MTKYTAKAKVNNQSVSGYLIKFVSLTAGYGLSGQITKDHNAEITAIVTESGEVVEVYAETAKVIE